MPSGTHCWKHDIWYPSLGECPRCLAEESAERQREHYEREEEAREHAVEREREREREDEEARERAEEREAERERERGEALEREEVRERERERRHEELVQLREREIYERNNPGDYKCPECLLISLKRGASRCPMCHAVIGGDFWPPIYEKERLEAEEKARREKLATEERARREKLAAEEWAKGEPERKRQAKAAAEYQERKRLEAVLSMRAKQAVMALVAIVVVVGFVLYGIKSHYDEAAPPPQAQRAAVVPAQTIRMVAPVGKWSERVQLKTKWIRCEEFSSDVLIQGDDVHRTIVDGPTNRNWAGIGENNNLRTIRFRAKGNQAVKVTCYVYSVPPTGD